MVVLTRALLNNTYSNSNSKSNSNSTTDITSTTTPNKPPHKARILLLSSALSPAYPPLQALKRSPSYRCHIFPSTWRGIAGAHPLPERELRGLTRGERAELLRDVEGIEKEMRGEKEEKGVFTGTRMALGKLEAEQEGKGKGEDCLRDGGEVREGWFEDEDEDEDEEDVMDDDFVLLAPCYNSHTVRKRATNTDTSTTIPTHPPSSLAFDKIKPARPANPSLLSRLLSSSKVPNIAAAPLEHARPPTPPLEGDEQAFLRASAYFAKYDAARVPLLAVGWKFGGGETSGEGRVDDTPAVNGEEDTCTIDSVEREFSDSDDEAGGDEESKPGEDEYDRCRRIVFGRASGASEADDGTEMNKKELGRKIRNAQIPHEDIRISISISISSEDEDSVSDEDVPWRRGTPSPDHYEVTCFGVDPGTWPVDLASQLSNAEITIVDNASTTAPRHDLDPTHAIPPARHPSDQKSEPSHSHDLAPPPEPSLHSLPPPFPSPSPPPSKLTISLLALALLSTATYLKLTAPLPVRQNPAQNPVPATCAPACPNVPPSTVFARSSPANYTASPYVPVERVFRLAARAMETGQCAVVVDAAGEEGEDGSRGVLERVGDVLGKAAWVGVAAWAGRWRWGWGEM